MKSTARRTLYLLVGLLLMAAGLACGPKVSPEQMGEVVFEVPDIPGTEEPYPLPELEGGEPPQDDAAGDEEAQSDEAQSPEVESPEPEGQEPTSDEPTSDEAAPPVADAAADPPPE
jgi:hypothetical protein